MAQSGSRRGDQVVITNRKARHDYLILDTWECGIVLLGPEVKSIRDSRANLLDAYARVEDGEIWSFKKISLLTSLPKQYSFPLYIEFTEQSVLRKWPSDKLKRQ